MNNTTKPFGELSNAEKKELLCTWVDGKDIEWKSCSDGSWRSCSMRPSWQSSTCYRIKPAKKLSFDWSAIDKKYKYAAMDADGSVHVFEVKPRCCRNHAGRWYATVRKFWLIDGLASLDRGEVSWEDSLIERPKTNIK